MHICVLMYIYTLVINLHVNLVLFYSQLHVQHFYYGSTSCNYEMLIVGDPLQHA